MINVTKLSRELMEAGIPIDGVADTEPPRIDFQPQATEKQRQAALAILEAHVPEDYSDQRQVAYLQAGITAHALVIALWERVVEGRPESADALQSKRSAIKARFPKETT